MSVDRNQVLRIADLAKLQFDPVALDQFVGQFQRILEYIEQLKRVDIEGIAPTSHVSTDTGHLRDDRIGASLTAEDALANAPDAGSGQFRVPKVIT